MPSPPAARGRHFVAEVAQETWVLFPWDTAPLFVPPIGKGPPSPAASGVKPA